MRLLDPVIMMERGVWVLMLADYFFFAPETHPMFASWIPVAVIPLAIVISCLTLSSWPRWTCVMLLIFTANLYSAASIASRAP